MQPMVLHSYQRDFYNIQMAILVCFIEACSQKKVILVIAMLYLTIATLISQNCDFVSYHILRYSLNYDSQNNKKLSQ